MASCSGEVPVTLIAGSFAAGKGTLINKWLELLSADASRVAVISHRFAEEYCCQTFPIRQDLCELVEEVYDYGSGCLCCAPDGELATRLNSIQMWGKVYDRVIIRVGAMADPLMFAAAVQQAGNYCVDGIVTVVDHRALLSENQLNSEAATKQVEGADLVIIWDDAERSSSLDTAEQALTTKYSFRKVARWAYVFDSGLSPAEVSSILRCREENREYPMVEPVVPWLLSKQHATLCKAVQINECCLVCPEHGRKWVKRWMDRGCCIRLKAILTYASSKGDREVLLIDAVRGRAVTFNETKSPPTQCLFGDLEVLATANTAEAAMQNLACGSVLSRVFVLLGPPLVAGIGDVALPTADEIIDDFRAMALLDKDADSIGNDP